MGSYWFNISIEQCTFFSIVVEAFFRIDHVVGPKFKKTTVI